MKSDDKSYSKLLHLVHLDAFSVLDFGLLFKGLK